jgi:hypothetical protein
MQGAAGTGSGQNTGAVVDSAFLTSRLAIYNLDQKIISIF